MHGPLKVASTVGVLCWLVVVFLVGWFFFWLVVAVGCGEALGFWVFSGLVVSGRQLGGREGRGLRRRGGTRDRGFDRQVGGVLGGGGMDLVWTSGFCGEGGGEIYFV